MKTKYWIIIFALLIIISGGVWFFMGRISYEEKVAIIYKDGEVYTQLDLNSVDEPYEINVENEDGSYNTVYVENGQISMSHASCPDQICVNHKPISDGIEPIVCLPNKVSIQIEKSESDNIDTFGG